MKCPHCLKSFHSDNHHFQLVNDPRSSESTDQDGRWSVLWEKCPSCERLIIHLCAKQADKAELQLVHPKGIARAPLSPAVPDEFAQDYREACLVLADSPKASAALSRRCLQHFLREAAKTKKKDLAEQIDEVLPSLPSFLAEMIDTVRVMGNFAAYPIKSTNTGEIIDVEPGEAEWLLDTLEMAFDFYFVQPAEAERKRDAINAKLKDAGKPLLKEFAPSPSEVPTPPLNRYHRTRSVNCRKSDQSRERAGGRNHTLD